MSEAVNRRLQAIGGYHSVYRGEVELKVGFIDTLTVYSILIYKYLFLQKQSLICFIKISGIKCSNKAKLIIIG